MSRPALMISVIIILTGYGCTSEGPTIRIETPEPTGDFVVVCKWVKDGVLNIHGGKKISDKKVFITESGKEVDCGISIWGGQGGASILHPLYSKMEGEEVDGVNVVKPVSKLEIIDQQAARFETGYWDKERNPARSYLASLPGCGFPPLYFDHYFAVKKIDREYFKRRYGNPIFKCMQREYEEILKHDPYSAKQIPNAVERAGQLWESEQWKKYR